MRSCVCVYVDVQVFFESRPISSEDLVARHIQPRFRTATTTVELAPSNASSLRLSAS